MTFIPVEETIVLPAPLEYENMPELIDAIKDEVKKFDYFTERLDYVQIVLRAVHRYLVLEHMFDVPNRTMDDAVLIDSCRVNMEELVSLVLDYGTNLD